MSLSLGTRVCPENAKTASLLRLVELIALFFNKLYSSVNRRDTFSFIVSGKLFFPLDFTQSYELQSITMEYLIQAKLHLTKNEHTAHPLHFTTNRTLCFIASCNVSLVGNA